MLELSVEAEASADLDDILRFGIVRFGEAVAERYFDSIERVMLRLRDFPDSGVRYPGVMPPVRYVAAGSHRIFYSHIGDRVIVRRVLHQAMRPHGRIPPL